MLLLLLAAAGCWLPRLLGKKQRQLQAPKRFVSQVEEKQTTARYQRKIYNIFLEKERKKKEKERKKERR
jgi:hypothetical protein